MAGVAAQRHQITTEETRNVSVDISAMLDSGETLTGSPTVTASGITISSAQINSSAITINGSTVAIGKAVQFIASSATVGNHTIEIRVSTSASQTLEAAVVVVARATYA